MYTVDIIESPDLAQLEHLWTAIQASVDDVPFFLSWAWISCWLKSYHPTCIQVTAYHERKAVCIGLLTRSAVSRRRLIHSRQLRLHQTGRQSEDQIWIEYNDFLVPERHRHAAITACLDRLRSLSTWDELLISMIAQAPSRNIQHGTPYTRVVQRIPAYSVDLAPFHGDPERFIPSLSSNTRYQVRKSIRLFNRQYGSLFVEIAATEDQAIDYFHQAGTPHRERWRDSGFNNPDFVRFHEQLIRENHGAGRTLLMRTQAGDTTIGVLYFLLNDRTAFFYLHGLNYPDDPKLKPGLVAHTLAIQYFIEHGINLYDFMGGHSQYKLQLGRFSQFLDILLIQKPLPRFFIENLARKLKNDVAAVMTRHP